MSIIVNAIDSVFPEKSRIVKRPKVNPIAWFDDNLRHMREHLHFLHEYHKRNPTHDNKAILNNFRSTYRCAIIEAKKISNDNFIVNHNNPQQAMWKIVNGHKQTPDDPSVNISCDDFNNYFANIAEEIINKMPPCNVRHTQYLKDFIQNNKLSFNFVSSHEVADVIINLKNKKCKDAYDITIRVIKGIMESILNPLTNLINICLSQNIFPDCLKIAKVVPIYKKNDVNDPSYHRPISVIPCFAKIYEILLKNQLTMHMEINNLFNTSQYGFRNKLSTTLAINKLTSIINTGFEEGNYVCSMFFDLTKAFDCVSHRHIN